MSLDALAYNNATTESNGCNAMINQTGTQVTTMIPDQTFFIIAIALLAIMFGIALFMYFMSRREIREQEDRIDAIRGMIDGQATPQQYSNPEPVRPARPQYETPKPQLRPMKLDTYAQQPRIVQDPGLIGAKMPLKRQKGRPKKEPTMILGGDMELAPHVQTEVKDAMEERCLDCLSNDLKRGQVITAADGSMSQIILCRHCGNARQVEFKP